MAHCACDHRDMATEATLALRAAPLILWNKERWMINGIPRQSIRQPVLMRFNENDVEIKHSECHLDSGQAATKVLLFKDKRECLIVRNEGEMNALEKPLKVARSLGRCLSL